MKAVVGERVVMDFLTCLITSACFVPEQIKSHLKSIYIMRDKSHDQSKREYTSIPEAFTLYVGQDNGERFQRFCQKVLHESYSSSTNDLINERYNTLKTALTELFVEHQSNEAAEVSEKFENAKNIIVQGLQQLFENAINKFSEQFTPYEETDIKNYINISSARLDSQLYFNGFLRQDTGNGHEKLIDEIVKKGLMTNILKAVRDCISFRTSREKDVSVAQFCNTFVGVDVNTMYGAEWLFKHTGPDIKELSACREKCNRLGAIVSDEIIAFDTRLIKLDVRNPKVIVRELTSEELPENGVSKINNIDVMFPSNYYYKAKRIVVFSLELSVSCTEPIVGGGLLISDGETTV